MKKIFVSGAQPSGELHIGNYLGAIKHWIELQDTGELFIFIADLHSLTQSFNPKEKQAQIFDLAVNCLALGIDPKKTVFFKQSDICGPTELGWIFNCVTPMSFLERMTQYKDKATQQKENINVGLFTYPTLMAADILLFRANHVPVGEDQVQHLEITRDIARWFNNKFGDTFEEPKPILTKVPRLMSLVDPNKKMSKSHGSASYIALADEPEVIKSKIAKAVTDTSPVPGAMSAGVANLFVLLEHFGTLKDVKQFRNAHKDGSIRYSELKTVLAERIIEYFAPFRAARKKLFAHPEKVDAILRAGAKRAQKVADKTMAEVRKRVGLI